MKQLYELVCTRLYYGDETFEIGENRYDPVALFGLLTLILDGKELIFGDYGSGKTTSSERIASLVKAVPLEFVQAATVHGHPEQTEEKIKATLDLGSLEREGKEVVKWKITPFCPAIIIDEINRLPAGKQSMLLNEVDRNIWSYRGSTLITGSRAFFATINYQDIGTTKLIPPLLDRFDVAVETGRIHPVRKRLVRRGIDDSFLRDAKLAEEMIVHVQELNGKEAEKYVQEVSDQFREKIMARLEKDGINVHIPSLEEIEKMRDEIEKIDVSDDAELFLDYLSQEAYCQLGRKDFAKCDGCHYANYVCSDIYCISNRAERSLFVYSKALAWFEGEGEVTMAHVIAALPYVLWHRCGVSDAKLAEVRDVEKDTSDEFYAVRDTLLKAKRRWEEHRNYQISAYKALREGDVERLEQIAEKIGHPFFTSLTRG
ncbi:AAA family ATPase [Archaeoglobus veneficus]|uniref:ATPase associated with various cellular activities AAA_5 n=1 Tax=Archaeoglobus veneficus (strain DSM 11195 / SNP6) TaxID=693661 RepID=F2KRC3_ARCVS|nr:MoxR family ATPase [Archaeoglobus veneficus]AEA47857.1 ATPase associated with various cellular activities AAA_5 [Archaeoglobus veneficus SNP6]